MGTFFDDASLAFLPSGAAGKDGKAYSIKPTNGTGDFTFSRGSNLSATRIGPDGLIEKGRENLLKQSNQFDTTWTKQNATIASGQSGYDGSSNAWLFTATNSGANLIQSVSSSGVNTFSVYAKAGTEDGIFLRVDGGDNPRLFFKLSTGAKGSTGGTIIDSSIESVGNGWYRLSLVANVSITHVKIYVADDNNGFPSSGNILIQSAQLEAGLVATEPIESGATTGKAGLLEDEPRFDYSGGATCPSLLLEPSRTNIMTQSEFAALALVSNVTKTNNYTTSPEGVSNGTRLQFTANGFVGNNTQASSTQYTLSCYAKRNDSGTQSVGFFVNGSGSVNSAWSLTSDWQRFTYTYTSSNTSYAGVAGISGADISVYGFQMEAAPYATSYIPTYGSSVTRVAEGQTYSGFSSLIGQTQGTLFLEVDNVANNTEIFSINRSTANAIFLRAFSNRYGIYVWSDGATWAPNTSIVNTDRMKIAIAYKSNDFAIYANGSQVATNNTLTWTPNITIDTLNFNVGGYISNKGNPKFNQLLLFKTRLSNAELATLTTL